MQQDGLVGASTDGRRSIYSLTDRGHQALRARGEELAALEVRTGIRLRAATSVDGMIDRFATRARSAGASARRRATEQLLNETATRLETLARAPGSS